MGYGKIGSDENFFEIQIIFQRMQLQYRFLKEGRTKEIGQVKYLPKIFFYDITLNYSFSFEEFSPIIIPCFFKILGVINP